MKFTVRPAQLASALNLVSRAINTKSTLPVLNNVLLHVRDGMLSLSTTNLEIAITHWIPVENAVEGSVTVPVKLLAEYTSLLRSDTMNAELRDGYTLHLEGEGFRTDMKGIAADEFPLIPEVEKESEFRLPVATFAEAVAQTAFASAITDTRPVLAGVYFNIQGDTVKLVATDSYRLAEKTIELLEPAGDAKMIVPARTIMELGRILPKYEETVRVVSSRNQVLFELADVRLISRLIEGQFPPYEQIIPKEWKCRAGVETEELLTVTRRAALFVRESAHSVKFVFDPDNGKILLSATQDQVGGEAGEVRADLEGERMEIAFNGQYLVDALTNMGAPEVRIDILGESSPGVVRPVESDDYLHIIMPLKV